MLTATVYRSSILQMRKLRLGRSSDFSKVTWLRVGSRADSAGCVLCSVYYLLKITVRPVSFPAVTLALPYLPSLQLSVIPHPYLPSPSPQLTGNCHVNHS